MARRTALGMPIAEFERLTREDCTTCGAPAPRGGNAPQRDKSVLCLTCYNASVAETSQQQAAERASAKRCECCNRRRGTVLLLCSDRQVLVCGRCQSKANRRFAAPVLYGPAPRPTSSELLASVTA